MSAWSYAENDPSAPPDPALKFFAQADKQTNQETAPFTPCGWWQSMVQALSECIKAIHRFPYEGPRG